LDEGGDSSTVEEDDDDDAEAGSSLDERLSKMPKRENSDNVGGRRTLRDIRYYDGPGVPSDLVSRIGIGTPSDSEASSGIDDEEEEEEEEDEEADEQDVDESKIKMEVDEPVTLPSKPKKAKKKPILEEKDAILYSDVMRDTIQALPLPPSLKNYLNYYREF
jgi:hypothetical protein